MQGLWMKKPRNIARRSERTRSGPFELEHQHRFIAHAARTAKDRFDGGVDRLDDAKAHPMVTVGCDPFDVGEEKITQSLHFRKALPAERSDPSEQEVQHAAAGLVLPEAIELLAQDIGLEQAPVDGKQRSQLGAFRTADGVPAAQQQPAFATPVGAHHRAGAEELLAPDLIERCRGVLQNMKFIEDGLRLGQHLGDDIEIGPMHVGTDGFYRGPLAGVQVGGQQGAQTRFATIPGQADDFAPHQVRQYGKEMLAFAALDLVGPQMSWPTFGAGAVPGLQERAFGTARPAPAHRMADGRMTGGHRLTIEPDALAEPTREPCVGVRKADPFTANAARPAPQAAQAIPYRHRMFGPRQVIPRAQGRIAHPSGPSTATGADVTANATPLDYDH